MDWKLFACQNSIHPEKNLRLKYVSFFCLCCQFDPHWDSFTGFPFHKLWSVFFILSLSLRWLTDKLTGVVSDIKFGQQRGSQNFLEFRLLWIIFQRIQLETSAQEKKHNLIPHLQLVLITISENWKTCTKWNDIMQGSFPLVPTTLYDPPALFFIRNPIRNLIMTALKKRLTLYVDSLQTLRGKKRRFFWTFVFFACPE